MRLQNRVTRRDCFFNGEPKYYRNSYDYIYVNLLSAMRKWWNTIGITCWLNITWGSLSAHTAMEHQGHISNVCITNYQFSERKYHFLITPLIMLSICLHRCHCHAWTPFIYIVTTCWILKKKQALNYIAVCNRSWNFYSGPLGRIIYNSNIIFGKCGHEPVPPTELLSHFKYGQFIV